MLGSDIGALALVLVIWVFLGYLIVGFGELWGRLPPFIVCLWCVCSV